MINTNMTMYLTIAHYGHTHHDQQGVWSKVVKCCSVHFDSSEGLHANTESVS